MENTTSALWLKVVDRFRFIDNKKSYYVKVVKSLGNDKIIVFITGSKAKCFTMSINNKIIKITS